MDNTISELPLINVMFPVYGRQLPADHGYLLYSAIARCAPILHKNPGLSLGLISGVPWREGIIALATRGASLRLRIPAASYRDILQLTGKRLDIDGHAIRLGIPSAHALSHASSLYARIVTIKKFMEPAPFLDAAHRQLDRLEIAAKLELPLDEQGRFRRRIVRIHDKAVVGFSLAAHELNDGDSIRLQTFGIGGRRSMGCGFFNPIAKARAKTDLPEK